MSLLAEQRVGCVAAIELADGKQVDRRQQESKPRGKPDRAQREVLVRHIGPHPVCDRLEQERLAEAEAPFRRYARTRARRRNPNEERGDADDEAGERARESDVDERSSVGKRRADENESAQGADDGKRKRDEHRKRCADSIASCSQVVTELVARDDRHDGEAERKSEHDALPQGERALDIGQVLEVDRVERSDVKCGSDRQEEKNERQRAALREPEREPDEELFQASCPVTRSVGSVASH